MLDLKQVILNIDGSEAMQSFPKPGVELDEEGKPTVEAADYRAVMLKDMVLKALTTLNPEDGKSVSTKLKQYALLKKVQSVTEVELTEDEKTMLCNRIGRQYEVLFAGQAIELIKMSK